VFDTGCKVWHKTLVEESNDWVKCLCQLRKRGNLWSRLLCLNSFVWNAPPPHLPPGMREGESRGGLVGAAAAVVDFLPPRASAAGPRATAGPSTATHRPAPDPDPGPTQSLPSPTPTWGLGSSSQKGCWSDRLAPAVSQPPPRGMRGGGGASSKALGPEGLGPGPEGTRSTGGGRPHRGHPKRGSGCYSFTLSLDKKISETSFAETKEVKRVCARVSV